MPSVVSSLPLLCDARNDTESINYALRLQRDKGFQREDPSNPFARSLRDADWGHDKAISWDDDDQVRHGMIMPIGKSGSTKSMLKYLLSE